MGYNIALRLWVLVIAITSAILFTVSVLRPYFLEPLALVDTNSTVQIVYQQIKNSVLVNMLPTEYWFWFNGRNIYVFGIPTGILCDIEKDKHAAAFVIDISQNNVTGYECISKLEDLQKYYSHVPKQYIFTRPKKKNFNIYDAVSLLANRNIITIPKKGQVNDVNVPIKLSALKTLS